MKKRKLYVIVLSLFVGAVFGGVVGNIFSLVLPESVVKDFFLTSITFDLGGLINNEKSFSFFLCGIVVASKTPDIVECIPDP